MKKYLKGGAFAVFLCSCLSALALDKVSLQLQWLDQFQFAGYYMAKELGFYQEEGLEVEILPYKKGIIPIELVKNNQVNYAIGRSTLLVNRNDGADIMLLKAIFQISPLILLGKKTQNLKNIADIKNKRIMSVADVSDSIVFRSMLSANNIDFKKDVIIQKHSLNIQDLINDKTDLMASYISNEPYVLEKLGIESIIFAPSDYGFEYYDDILFTSKNEFKNHPKRVEKFVRASLKGWHWAFNHIPEAAQLIIDKYNIQNKTLNALIYEGTSLKKLALYKNKPLGNIKINKLEKIYAIYRSIGLVNKKLSYADFVYQDPETDFEKIKNFTRRHVDNGNFMLISLIMFSLILIVIFWNISLKNKIKTAIKEKLKNERLIFRQNRIKEMSMMISGLSHQWRQPLSTIGAVVMNIDALAQRNKLDQNALKEKLNSIENSVAFMSTTIDDFSNYLNNDNKQLEFSINKCIKMAIKLLESEFLNHSIEVEFFQKNEVLYTGCRNELLQVLIVVLNNAKNALLDQTHKKTISIKIETNEYLNISISDNGCGIKKSHLKKIFSPYFSTHNQHLDSGLGLYIAKNIIEDRFNGNISIINLTQGTVFTLTLGTYD